LAKLDKRVSTKKLSSLGFTQGTQRGWSYTIRSEEDIPDILDQLTLEFQTLDKNDESLNERVLQVQQERKLQAYLIRKRASFLGIFAPLSHSDFVSMFNGALILKSAGFKVLLPFGIIKRGGFLQPLEYVILYDIDLRYTPLNEYIKTLTDSPAIECRSIWKSMGIELGKIHKALGIAGISSTSQVYVNRENPSDVMFKIGKKFQCYPVLTFLRQAEDIAGSNFVYTPIISPLDRLRFLSNYFDILEVSDTEKRETLALVGDMTRHKAAKEWNVFQSDLPKKTTFLNLIRALDRYGQQE